MAKAKALVQNIEFLVTLDENEMRLITALVGAIPNGTVVPVVDRLYNELSASMEKANVKLFGSDVLAVDVHIDDLKGILNPETSDE